MEYKKPKLPIYGFTDYVSLFNFLNDIEKIIVILQEKNIFSPIELHNLFNKYFIKYNNNNIEFNKIMKQILHVINELCSIYSYIRIISKKILTVNKVYCLWKHNEDIFMSKSNIELNDIISIIEKETNQEKWIDAKKRKKKILSDLSDISQLIWKLNVELKLSSNELKNAMKVFFNIKKNIVDSIEILLSKI